MRHRLVWGQPLTQSMKGFWSSPAIPKIALFGDNVVHAIATEDDTPWLNYTWNRVCPVGQNFYPAKVGEILL